MLPKKNKMKREDFAEPSGKAIEYHSPHFITKVYQNPPHPLNTMKASVVVSGKIAKKAVDRNALKRRVYTLLQEYKDTHTNKNIVVIAKKGATNLPFSDAEKEIKNILKKIKI